MIDTVIFDMDGVLVDTEIVYMQWLEEYLRKKDKDIPKEKIYKMVGLSGKLAQSYLEKICGEDGEKLWTGYLEACESYPFSYKEVVIPGIEELLEYLKRAGISMALASSSDMKDIQEMLDETGFDKYFHIITSGEMFKESKPNPEIYLYTIEQLGKKSENCIVIEDSDYGILAGKEAGTYVIAREDKRFGFSQKQADIIAKNTYDIGRILKKLLKKE